MTRASMIFVVLVAVAAGCASPPGGRSPSGAGPAPSQPAVSGPKRLTAAIMAEPPAFYRPLIPLGFQGQSGDLADLINGGLSTVGDSGVRVPQLAEAVPSVENRAWKLLPDGRMEVTWTIRQGAAWHDGTAFTTADLLFTSQILQDRELPEFRVAAFDLIESIEARDSRTIVVTWKKPYIWADRMFASRSSDFANPLPKHILETPYTTTKEGFRQLPYWSVDYIGLGPFRLRELMAGSHVSLVANEAYVLGRPKIDEIEVRFITDASTLTANLLSNVVDVTLGASLALEQAIAARDQWSDGKMEHIFSSWIVAFPQFLNPNPAVVSDLRFRRALLHAVDRQAMADTIQAGIVPVADSYVSPSEREYKETIGQVVRYDYNVRRSAELLEEIGYVKGSDGIYRDATGQQLAMEVRTTASPAIHTRAFFPLVDYWKRLGMVLDPVVIPVQRLTDLEYRTQQPTFEMVRYPNGADSPWRLHTNQTPLPESKYSGNNRSRYMNPELDGLIDSYLVTIPWNERMQVLGRIVHHVSDQLNVMGLFYDAKSFMVANRMVNFAPADSAIWNAHLWDVKS